ncbi:hypothetical protein BCR42DRAFT_379263 [Absidia repens]|uniref:Uncharacterized protein n=1 Tax=Absidia repens TaxID=90262 RepID=A0A1X2I9N6_9FUNG|nr:hypothetical protein BCR42DRAFT_379263 [Absidia repens]
MLESSPCIVKMGSFFQCWSSASVDDKRCITTARPLTDCLAKPVQKTKNQNAISYHLARLTKQT